MDFNLALINWKSLVKILKVLAAIGAGGGVMSLITSALVGSNWPSPAKALVAFLLCIVGALIPIAIARVDLTNMVIVLPLMWVGSQFFYRAWFKRYGIAPWIETLFFNAKSEPTPPIESGEYYDGAWEENEDRYGDHLPRH